MSNCIFCEIVAKRAPASIVFQNDLCCAFMDIQPVNPGHVLIVPIAHVAFLDDLDEETGAYLFTIAQRLSRALRRSGEAAGQEVFHVHLHVFPRFRNDGFGLRMRPDYGVLPARSNLDVLAATIRAKL
jgi:histidine triad (HIT) family protein